MEKSFTRNTITRYEEIHNILTSGSTGLSSADYQFYLRYCKKHGIAHEKVSVVEKPVRSAHYASQKERYDDVMRRLSMGRGIGAIDYRFLKRYCKGNGITMPAMEITITARLKQSTTHGLKTGGFEGNLEPIVD